MSLLRQYALDECGPDGYPIAWHQRTALPGGGGSFDAIKDYVREETGYRCERCHHPYPPGIAEMHPRGEWTPCDERCTHDAPIRYRWGERVPWSVEDHVAEGWRNAVAGAEVQAHWRILTVHHLNGDKADCRWWNLAALCQRCHLSIQTRVIMGRVWVWEHSDWFKPHAGGWYAVAYLDENLAREQVMERLDELLALERLA